MEASGDMNTFLEQVQQRRPLLSARHLPLKVLAIDPGETTGWALFCNTTMDRHGQLQTSLFPQAPVTLCSHIEAWKPDVVVIEDYRVYKWKTDSHAWAALHTPKLIGVVEYFCYINKIPLTKQSAQVGKGFCTDERLKEWGLYQVAMRHANDAIRHACQYLMFGDT